MKIRTILCPVDFSKHSQSALAYATALAKDSDAELHLVYAYQEPYAYTDGGFAGYVPPADMEPDRERLEKLTPTDPSVRFCRKFLVGNPADALVDYAKDNDMDLIVMGTHGRSGIERLLMGSVAEAIVRTAPCPVLTIKQPVSESQPA
ncbi:MAG: universal stress protein [Planctomycetales bacterium]|nr:universal stress protein [Planctomycetales bacterium]